MSRAPGRGPACFPRPILDARLGDGSRVAICVPPASPHVAITVRPFGTRSFSAAQLIAHGALPAHIPDEAERVLHTPPQYPRQRRHRERQHDAAQRAHCPHPRRPADRRHRGHLGAPHRLPEPRPVRGAPVTAGSASRSATSCATPCGTAPITSSSAKCAAPKRPTCYKPSTPDPAARPPRHHPGERLPPRGRAGRPHPAALGQQSVSRRWRGRHR